MKKIYSLINSTNNKNKRILFKKKINYSILSVFFICAFFRVNAQKIDPNGFNTFYYADGTKSSEGFFKNSLPDSLWRTYNKEGKLISEGYYQKGLLDGTWIFYTSNGKIKQKSNFEFNLKNGCTVLYDSLEIKTEELFYINDTIQDNHDYFLEDGTFYKRKIMKDGSLIQLVEYNESGKINLIENYKNGVKIDSLSINKFDDSGNKTGYWRENFANGELKSESYYKEGKLNGLRKTYNKYGSLESIEYMVQDSVSNNSRNLVLIELYKEFHVGTNKEKLVGGQKNGLKNGLFREYNLEGKIVNGYLYENDTLLAKGLILNDGNFDSSWVYYYPNGNIQSEGMYINGKKEGNWVYYYENGKIQQKGSFRENIISGTWKLYYKSGVLKAEEYYRKGKLEGIIIEYSETGEVISKGNYLAGFKEGDWFYYVGGFKEVGSFTLNFKNGDWVSYYDNGNILFEGEFDEGQPKGKHLTYYDDGRLKSKGKYRAGMKQGKWTYYNVRSEVIEVLYFERGILIRINGERIHHFE